MSGNLIGGVIGAGIGFVVGGPMGALYGFSLGSAAGALLLPTDLPTQYGPRLSDLKAQGSEYGAPIPILYGTIALQGTVIWAADLIEVATEQEQGGKGGPSQTTVSYAYFGNFAVLVCEGPVTRVRRIWAGPGKRLIWDGANLESGSMTVYKGTEDQEPDPLIEAAEGVGNVPAYRGSCYVVFENFALKNDGNALPFLTFEVVATGEQACPVAVSTVHVGGFDYSIFDPAPQKITDTSTDATTFGRVFSDAATGLIYYTYKDASNAWWIDRVDSESGNSGPPLHLFDSGGQLKIAWDGAGTAAAIISGQTDVVNIDLALWTADAPTAALRGSICDAPDHCAVIDLAAADVVWMGDGPGNYGFLAQQNSVSGASLGVFAIEATDTITARAGFTYAVQWQATGARSGGDLTPFPDGGGAAHFTTQPSNYADDSDVYWSAYDSKRQILVDFTNGVYSNLLTHEYVNTAGFAIASHLPGQAVYSAAQDMFYAISSDGIRMYDPANLTPEGWPSDDCVLFQSVAQAYEDGTPIPVNFMWRLFLIANEPDYLGVLTGGGDLMKIRIARAGGVSLASVVADLSERAGESRYNVAALEADTVDGYAIARQTQVRAAIQPLRSAYYFDAVESQGVIRFVKRGGAVVTEIDDADLAAHEGGEAPDPLNTTRRMEIELPRAVTVDYMLAATEYEPATKQARRLIGSSGDEQTLDVPLVLSDTKAQEVAEVNLHSAWVERLSYQFTLPRKYSHLEPTDLVLVKGHLMRLTAVKATPRGVLECVALADESDYYAPHLVVTETPPTNNAVARAGVTRLELF